MAWNWQREDWPHFTYDHAALEPLERTFLKQAGMLLGAYLHVSPADQDQLKIELMSNEALKTSEIEGELLDRDSVQQSIRRDLGLPTLPFKAPPAEQGIAMMMVQLHQGFAEPLSQALLYGWHRMLMNGRVDVHDIGRYRTDPEPMQVVSGRIDRPEVHFEAPPAPVLRRETDRFIR
jgi:Fic family protein